MSVSESPLSCDEICHVTKSLDKDSALQTDFFKMQSRFFKLLVKEELRAISEITTESCPGKKLTLVIE